MDGIHQRRGFTLIDVVMSAVQIIGMIGVALLLRRFTALPLVVCVILSFPVFLIPFWSVLFLVFQLRARSRLPPAGFNLYHYRRMEGMDAFQQLTPASFGDFIQSNRIVVILFWARWEGIHLLIKKKLETEIASDLRSQFAFAGFDTDPEENWEIVRRHDQKCIPFLALYLNGNLVSTVPGNPTTLKMNRILRELIGTYPG